MVWQAEWKAISARIASLVNTSGLLVEAFKKDNSDAFGMSGILSAQVKASNDNLRKFVGMYKSLLPPDISHVLEEYLQSEGKQNDIPGNPLHKTVLLLLRISVLLSEVDYLLANTSETVKRQSERAFLHLQQSIVAAEDIRTRWQNAFMEKRGEEACEKLGAAHLLQHGIYAFKAATQRAQTDLIFNEPLNIADVERTSDGLVLTEWKVVKAQDKASTKAEEARSQAARYHAGVLGGIELVGYRYIVLVSEHQVAPPPDVTDNGVVYRHINIAVSPLSPSKAPIIQPQQTQPS